jgi:hypothetical protein
MYILRELEYVRKMRLIVDLCTITLYLLLEVEHGSLVRTLAGECLAVV